jgi:plastocyanin
MTTLTRRLLLATLAAVLAFALAACGGDDDSGGTDTDSGDAAADGGGGGTTVAVRDSEFVAPELTVSVGDTVTWNWEGNLPHDVTGDGFESELQSEGSFSHTFDTAGEYLYECTIHPGMEGTIIVE